LLTEATETTKNDGQVIPVKKYSYKIQNPLFDKIEIQETTCFKLFDAVFHQNK
jgi:hypothetical protein